MQGRPECARAVPRRRRRDGAFPTSESAFTGRELFLYPPGPACDGEPPPIRGDGRPTMAGNAVESGRTVTSKVTAILMAFADGTEWSLSELARMTNIPLTTTHRLVTELVAAQLLERSPEGYRVGPALGRLCATGTQAARPSPSSRPPSSTISPPSPAALSAWACCATCGWPTSRRPAAAPPPPSRRARSSRSTRARWARSCSPSLPPRSPARWSPRGCPASPRAP